MTETTSSSNPESVTGNILYDHVCSSLSELDLEMIRPVPPGGNWKDIPLEVARKSARVMKIRKTGGRTTYYGRLRPDLPAYTINTYFNRPGNGTFIHPSQDRLISQREAARLQSFRDSYRFLGSVSSKYKQIGNAVPPLLGRAVGSILKPGRTIDLFCGAGGLSDGLCQSDHEIILASDINKHMISTYEFNHSETEVLKLDIRKEESFLTLKERIESALQGKTLALLAGGPPCQGFSTAGKWNPDDARNGLLFRMLECVRVFIPTNVLIENVPGIKTMLDGKILEKITDTLNELEYNSHVFTLKAEEYGVPQRRRRVFIMGSRTESFEPPETYFSSITRGRYREDVRLSDPRLASPITVSEAISDLPVITEESDKAFYKYDISMTSSEYQSLMQEQVTFSEFTKRRANSTDTN